MKRTNNPDKNNNIARRVLILLASVITAIAVAVTCALCIPDSPKRVSVDNVQQGEVSQSTSASFTTAGTYNFATATGSLSATVANTVGKLNNGDILTFSYCGGVYSVTLPIGTYTFELWGAQGGAGNPNGDGGLGGYTKGTYTITGSPQTIYIVVGGAGTSVGGHSVATGGYNGGGNIVSNSANSSSSAANRGTGGGASHIAKTSNRGVLKNYESYKSEVIAVAGGGGGTGGSGSENPISSGKTYATVGGAGGGTNGTAADNSTDGQRIGGGGGTQTGGGTAGQYGGHATTATDGSFGQGGTGGCVGTNNWYCGGAGGGGWYGGGGGAGGGPGGGGGSGYSGGLIAPSSMENGKKTGNGEIKIKAVNVNKEPETKSYSYTLPARGQSVSKKITAGDLASDPEGTAVYFSNGTSGAYDTFSNFKANGGLWLDSGCTVSANRYFTWTTTEADSFTITGIKAYPRQGQTGVTKTEDSGNTVTVYTYIRDNYGSTSAGRGCSKISFTLKVPKTTNMALRTSGVTASVKDGANNVSSVDCLVGNATTSAAPGDPAMATGIYNPGYAAGQNKPTLFVKKTLMLGGSITLTASDLISNVASVDKAVIALSNTTNITGGGRKFKVTQLDNGTDKVTAYSTSGGAISNTFSKISMECVMPTPGYQVLPITIYVVENNAFLNSAMSNVALWDSSSTATAVYALDVVFKMENTRPVLKAGVGNVVDVSVGGTQALKLNDYFSDVDNGTITTSTHSILGVELPKKELLALDKLQSTVTFASPNANYYNIGNVVSGTTGTFEASGRSDADTGFVDGIVYNAAAGVGSMQQSFLSYTYSGDTLTVTGLRSSFSQYKQNREKTAPGHFYLLLHIRDNSDALDNGIWLPIAFTVGAASSHAPVATVTSPDAGLGTAVTSQTAAGTYPTASGAVGQSFYFAPMAINNNGSHVIGKYKAEDANGENTGALTDAGLQALALDGDNFATADGAADWNGGKLNELLTLNATPQEVAGSVSTAKEVETDVWQNQYFTVRYVDIYIPTSVFATAAYSGGRVVVGSGSTGAGYNYVSLASESGYYIVKGLKLTLRSATMNRYVYAIAGVKDVTNRACGTIKIAVRVSNTAPQAYGADSGKVVAYGDKETDNAYSTYEYKASGTPTLTYKVPLGSTFMVTPYDLAYDADMAAAGTEFEGGFTLNGYNGRYDATTGMFTANSMSAADGSTAVNSLFGTTSAYQAAATALLGKIVSATTVGNVSNTANGTAAGSAIAANASVYRDKLFFDRTTAGTDAYTYNPTTYENAAINYNASNVTNFVDVSFGTRVKIGDPVYDVDFMLITAKNRTNQPSVIDLIVRDRYGSGSTDGNASFTVRVVIEVVNTKPNVKDKGYYKELSVKPIQGVVDNKPTVVTPDVGLLYANGNGDNDGLMEDLDRDTPEYVLARGVAVVNKSFIDRYKSDITLTSFEGLDERYLTEQGVALTRYVGAELLSRQELSVRAYSSTKAIEGGVYAAFFATDNNGGISLGYVQIEVLNTSPSLNESEVNGFDASNPMWYIESASDADIMRSRYIAGSEKAVALVKSEMGALDKDVKLISTDDDGLHDKTVLSQIAVTTAGSVTTYNYARIDVNNYNAAELEAVVPSIGNGTAFDGTASAVKLFTRNTEGSSTQAGAPNGYRAELNFYVPDEDGEDGSWYTRSELIAALTADENALGIGRVFDDEGRFKIADWALLLRATSGFESYIDLGISLSLRDQAEKGGSTAGLRTAYNSDRNHKNELGETDNKVAVEGKLITTVYQHINKTGIRTINEYLGKNDNYYIVEYKDSAAGADEPATKYISTYDGDKTSTYASAQSALYYTSGENNKVILSNSGDSERLIKRRNAGDADGTRAGTNSGAVYDAGVTEAELEGAYRYTDVIELPAETASGNPATGESVTYRSVYVPMSYFGLLSTLATADSTDGHVTYPEDFVGYEVNYTTTSNPVVSLNDVNRIVQAMVLSDGTREWKGAQILSDDNPYFTLEAFDWYNDGDAATNGKALYDDEYSRPYYNNRLAVATLNPSDNTLVGFEKTKDSDGNRVNGNSFVGDGKIMYLEEQATELIEHNFGLIFTKKNVRTSTRNLTLTINLARYNKESGGGRLALTNGKVSNEDRGMVEVKIHIENTKLDLFNTETNGSNVKYDGVKGTYYVDVDLKSSETATYRLSRRAVKEQAVLTDKYTLEYYDDDYGTAEKRDTAYFSSDSFDRLTDWQIGNTAYKRVIALNADGDGFENVLATSEKAQKSVANYFGVKYGELNKLTASGSEYQTGAYKPNNGIYGSATNKDKTRGKEGYSSYFNASLMEGGTALSILPVRKTFINATAFEKEQDLVGIDKTDVEAVKAAYLERGLVAEYRTGDAALSPSRVYYPFKALIYDSFGAGFGDASYVAMEFRVSITNGEPTLKAVGEEVKQNGKVVGRQYSMNLAVGTSATINLYDVVYDADMFTRTRNGVNVLATQNDFETRATGVVLETGDYMDSPLDHDEYKSVSYNPAVQQDGDKNYYNGGGFVSAESAEYNNRDVVMWMSTDSSGRPYSNEITFTVHKRTTTKINKGGKQVSVSVDQYRFTLRFYDSTGAARTEPFTFIINITNQAPSLIPIERTFTMRSGDDVTLLSTYYDYFTGIVGNKTDAYENSESCTLMTERQASAGYGDVFGDGYNNLVANYWKYENITSTAERGRIVYNATAPGVRPQSGSMHLGYVGLANDDTPWKLRIADFKYNANRLRIEHTEMLAFEPEGSKGNYPYSQIAIRVVATGACVNEPVTVTLCDGEDGVIVCTLYFTIVSSPPIPLDCSDANNRATLSGIGLEGVENGNDEWEAKTYRTFIVPSATEAAFEVDGFTAPKTARRVTKITMSSVARDPDENETENMRLYGNGSFTVNGSPLVSDSNGVYRAEYFNIQPSRDGKSFEIIATGYNPDTLRGYEVLTFRIEDYGNTAYANSVEVTLHVYTLYSDLTNPTASTTSAYNAYLGGAEVVNVKSYDEYYDPSSPAAKSVFAYVALHNNNGNDGNTSSPIVDPDASVKGDASYNVRLYAFVDVAGETVKALSANTLQSMLERDGAGKTFRLKTNTEADYDDYLIGGLVDGKGITLNSAGSMRYEAASKYVDFEFDADGAAIMFTPKASTLDSKDVLLYVEAEKPMGQRSVAMRENAILNAGALFSLNVRDSAPQAVAGAHTAEGVKGDVGTFTVFNPVNRFDALFTDSDVGDAVAVYGMVDNKLADAEYANVMKQAETELKGLDWKADQATGKPRAFDLYVNADGRLEVKINRRVDYAVNGVYQPKVRIPLTITGVDKCGKTAETTVYLTVVNSDLAAVNAYSKFDAETNVGYGFEYNSSGEYEMNVRLRYGAPLEVKLSDIITDADVDGGKYDGDSYRFVSSQSVGVGYNYIVNESIPVLWYNTDETGKPNLDDTKTLATAQPLGDDETHRTGILFTAAATERDLTATVYVRVIDRAGNAEIAENGIVIRINVIVMNDAPYVLDGKETTTLYMLGSENNEPEAMLFYIGDFVADHNASDVVGDELSFKNADTYLRISGQDPRAITELYSRTYEQIPESFGISGYATSAALFEMTTPAVLDDKLIRAYCARMGKTYTSDFKDTTNLYNQWFVIKPRKGFYGNGAIDITVMDGNPRVKYDTLYTTFCIEVHVISNADEVIEDLSAIELACSKTRQVDIRSLMPDMENKLELPTGTGGGGVQASADGDVFNQYAYYNIVSIGFQNEVDKNKATFTQLDGDGQLWEIKAGNQVTREPVRVAVRFALKSDGGKAYTKYFYLNVIANRSPKAKYSEIEFKRYNKGEADALRDLTDANSIRLEAWQLFEDADDPEGTAIRFLAVESQVSSLVKAKLIRDDSGEYRYLELSFVGRGESEITVTVTDETGTPVKLKFTASNKDLPEASMWVRLAASFEANTVIWVVIIGCALLLIVILIIIIAVIHKRKRAREELEALLVSEMEIEEQMLRLAGGPAPTNYQSFGYLQGAATQQPDPSMMLGVGDQSAQPQLTALPPAQGEGGEILPPDDGTAT